MKTRSVDFITSNEDHVRLKIYDGLLPADEATQELLELERAQHKVTREKLAELRRENEELRLKLARLCAS